MTFNNEEKIELFNLIENDYFNHNFGTKSKSELELMFFHFYYTKRQSRNLPTDDFSLSVELGITQNRVRSLKEKMAYRFSELKDNWIDDFKGLIKYAKYDEVKHLIKLHIPNIETIIQLRQFLENNHLYDEYQLNPKLFQCKAEVFIDIIELLYEGENLNEYDIDIKKVEMLASKEKIDFSAIEKIKSGDIKGGLKELMKSCSKSVLLECLNMFPFGNIISALISAIQ